MSSSMLRVFWSIVAISLFNFHKETHSLGFRKQARSKIRNIQNDRYPAFDIPITKSQPSHRLLLCPANTAPEKELNEAFSLGGNGLFTVDRITDSFNIQIPKICHDPIKPVIIYNLADQKYEVGYELYIEEHVIEPEFPVNINYHSYAPIRENNEIINSTELAEEKYHPSLSKYQDGDWTIIKINAEPYRPRIFHWKRELYFNHFNSDKTTQRVISIQDVEDEDLTYKCSDDLLDESLLKIYSPQNQESCLMDTETPAPPPGTSNQTKTSVQPIQTSSLPPHKQSSVHMVKSQIIPSWYFHTPWSKLASCTRINIVPVWKTIADGQLKKVDLYLLAAEYQLRNNVNYIIEGTIFGVTDILNLPNKRNPSTSRDSYLWDFENRQSQKIPVPRIIYRIFSLTSIGCGKYGVAIIIHNALTNVPDSERICTPVSQPTGWDRIENNDMSIGLTYTCPLTIEVLSKLAVYDITVTSSEAEFLRLDEIRNRPSGYEPKLEEPSKSLEDLNIDWSDYWSKSKESVLSPTTTFIPFEKRDETMRINAEYERFLKLV